MTAAEIARALGGARRTGPGWSCRCPVHDDRSPSLSLRDGGSGLLVFCHAGCDPHDVLAVLRQRGLLGGEADYRAAPLPTRHEDGDDSQRIAWARQIWEQGQDARGSPVARYLVSRGIVTAPPQCLRYAPALRRLDGTSGPAMVARIDNSDGELVGVHRTWLDRGSGGQWRRLDRAMLGRVAGGAVRLAPAAATLMVGEGLETCLAAMPATGQSAWVALSTSGLIALALPPLPMAATVIILADHDTNGAGERAAYSAADRWLAEGRRVRIALPPEPGSDFNDVLAGRAHAHTIERVA